MRLCDLGDFSLEAFDTLLGCSLVGPFENHLYCPALRLKMGFTR